MILGGALTSSSCGGGNKALFSPRGVSIRAFISSRRFSLSESFDSSAVRLSNLFRPLVPSSCCNRFLMAFPWVVMSQVDLSAGIEALREGFVPELEAVLAAVSRAVSPPLSVERLAALLESDSLLTSSAPGVCSTTVYLDPSVLWMFKTLLLDDG